MGLPGLEVREAETPEQLAEALSLGELDAAVVDYHLPWTSGPELLRVLHARQPGLPVLLLTGTADERKALDAAHEGLEEYLPKVPESYALLPLLLRFACARARQRQELLESRETLRRVIEGVRDHAIFLLDAEGHVSSWNPGAHAVTGREEEAVQGLPLAALFQPCARPGEAGCEGEGGVDVARVMREASAQGRAAAEGWLVRPGGAHAWVELTVGALRGEGGGGPHGYTAVLRDATARRRTEEFRERLLGVVGHDLRSPLQAILLQAQLLRRTPSASRSTESAASRITLAAERMGRLIADLLDLTRSRLGAGIPVERQPLDLFAHVRHVVEEVELSSGGLGHISLGVSGEGEGEFDPDRVAQVVQNLVSNAMKYGEPGGTVTVRLEGREREVVLSVHNRGTPIPPALLPTLFDPFQRGGGHADTGRLGRGLGLGLYITHEVVLAHGGRVDVTSTAQEGTTFRVHLPRGAPDASH
jgi:PAS domain S-box-containing protein